MERIDSCVVQATLLLTLELGSLRSRILAQIRCSLIFRYNNIENIFYISAPLLTQQCCLWQLTSLGADLNKKNRPSNFERSYFNNRGALTARKNREERCSDQVIDNPKWTEGKHGKLEDFFSCYNRLFYFYVTAQIFFLFSKKEICISCVYIGC